MAADPVDRFRNAGFDFWPALMLSEKIGDGVRALGWCKGEQTVTKNGRSLGLVDARAMIDEDIAHADPGTDGLDDSRLVCQIGQGDPDIDRPLGGDTGNPLGKIARQYRHEVRVKAWTPVRITVKIKYRSDHACLVLMNKMW